MSSNIPPLAAMNLEPGHVSVRVSLINSNDYVVIAALAVNIIFKFGSDMEQQQGGRAAAAGSSPPVPSYIHTDMARLTRDDFYGLLNSRNLTNVAVEVGVCEGDFARNMLSNWHGERYVYACLYVCIYLCMNVRTVCVFIFFLIYGVYAWIV
jgi:hypothetical protein